MMYWSVAGLVKFYVDDSAHGRVSVKQTLMKCSIGFAKQTGYSQLYLESFPGFTIAMYKRFGFQPSEYALGNSGDTSCNVWTMNVFGMRRSYLSGCSLSWIYISLGSLSLINKP